MPEEKQDTQDQNISANEKTDKEGASESMGGNISSPEGVLMLSIAGLIDIISFIPVINIVSDVLGIIIIGGWLVITRPGQAMKKALRRFLIAIGIELVPIVSIFPTWTWFVYKTLKETS